MIADLRQHLAFDILESKAAVANHLAGLFEAYSPQTEPVICITVHVALDPGSYPLLIKGIRIVLHDLPVGQNFIESIEIVHAHLA